MFIRLENIKDSELSWVATTHDTYLVNENPEVLKGLLKWQFLELPLIVKVNEYGERINWDEESEGYIRYQLIKNYMPSSLIKTVKAAEKKELS